MWPNNERTWCWLFRHVSYAFSNWFPKSCCRNSWHEGPSLNKYNYGATGSHRWLNLSLSRAGHESFKLNHCLFGVQDAGKHANYDVFSVPQNEETAEVLFDDVDYLATWKAMEELVKKGKVKSIGEYGPYSLGVLWSEFITFYLTDVQAGQVNI